MAETKYTWHKVADDEVSALRENELRVITVDHKKLCLTRWQDSLYAFTHKCPHAGGQLAEGYVDAHGNIVCPIHRYKYNLKNGYNSSGEGYYLKTYPVACREDGIYIGIAPSSGFFGLFK